MADQMKPTDDQVERVAIAMWNEDAPERAKLEPEAIDSDLARKYWRLSRAALSAMQPTQTLAKHQPCGCVVCTCEDEHQCQGCGAKSCGSHGVGEIPNPIYVDPPKPSPAEAARVLLGARIKDSHIHAAMVGHYGKRAAHMTIEGLDLTSNDKNWTFKEGFKRMLRAYLRAIAGEDAR